MKRIVVVALVLVAAELGFGFQKAAEWTKYSSPEGRYSVLLPAEPKLSTQESATAEGVKFPQYLATSSDSNVLFQIGYFDNLPNNTFSLDKARDGFLNAIKGTLVSESAISLGGYPGRETRMSGKGEDNVEYILIVRMYDVKTRVYVVQYIFKRSAETPALTENARRYFDSFAVTPTP